MRFILLLALTLLLFSIPLRRVERQVFCVEGECSALSFLQGIVTDITPYRHEWTVVKYENSDHHQMSIWHDQLEKRYSTAALGGSIRSMTNGRTNSDNHWEPDEPTRSKLQWQIKRQQDLSAVLSGVGILCSADGTVALGTHRDSDHLPMSTQQRHNQLLLRFSEACVAHQYNYLV